MQRAATTLEVPQPVILVQGRMAESGAKAAYLVVEKQILCKIDACNIPITLLAAYYAFNICYCHGCTNVYSFFEVLFLDASPPKRTRLRHFLTRIENTA